MKRCISMLISALTKLWRTIASTFVKSHLYKKDVDADGKDELVIDLNGDKSNDVISEKINNKD